MNILRFTSSFPAKCLVVTRINFPVTAALFSVYTKNDAFVQNVSRISHIHYRVHIKTWPNRYSENKYKAGNSVTAGPKPGWERRGYTNANMTRHIDSYTEHNTPRTWESVLRACRVSLRRMHEAKHGVDASCSPPTVVAARTLPAVGLLPSGWPPREPYRQAFP